ncbi:MAG: VWA domain-containing protein [Gemmatimonadota bacterium]
MSRRDDGSEIRERPLEWTARLGRALREDGVACTVAESLAATRALEYLDLGDALDVYFGLRSVFTSEPVHAPAFDRCFWELWGRRQRGGWGRPARPSRPAGWQTRRELVNRLHRRSAERSPEHPASSPETSGRGRTGAAYSALELLAQRSFGSLDEREVRELDRAFDRLLIRLATRRSRRLQSGGRRGSVDLRRSLRAAVHHDAELIRLARRQRRIDRPRVVLLCDVSGSMERYSRFLLRFLLAATRDRSVEVFAFSTRLTRLTPWLAGVRADEALVALGDHVRDWSGGTRIGACLEEFLERYSRSMLGQKTVVVILSDGLDRGDIASLERAMRGIRRRTRRVIWLNPLLESPQYRPEARGMKAALPYVDDFAPGHSLEALRQLARLIRL